MTSTVNVIIAAVVGVAVVASAAALTWHGSLSGGDFLGVVAGVVGIPSLGLGATSIAKTSAAAAQGTKP